MLILLTCVVTVLYGVVIVSERWNSRGVQIIVCWDAMKKTEV